MKTYLDEPSGEDKVKSKDPKEPYKIGLSEKFTYACQCLERAIKYLGAYKGKDFFLNVSYGEPRGPSLCLAPFNHTHDGFKFDNCPNFQNDLLKKPFMQRLWAGEKLYAVKDEINKSSDGLPLFLGYSSSIDYKIGRALDKIKEVAPGVTAIFTSDHGDTLGARRLFSKNATACKEVANVPLAIKRSAGRCVENAMTSHINIIPTTMDYSRPPIPKLLEGRSMLPRIHDTSKKINDVVCTEFTGYETDHNGFSKLQIMRAVMSKRYKLVIHLLDSDEFYDLKKNKHEMNNLISNENYTETRNAVYERLVKYMSSTKDLYRDYQWYMRPWREGFVPDWDNEGYTRQRENGEYEPRQLDYDTGFPMESAARKKKL